MWHTRFRVSLCSHVPPVPSGTPRNQHPLLSSPANSCGWKIPQHLQRAHRCAGHAPRRAQGPFPKHRSKSSRGSGQGKPSGSQDVSACSITTRNWQPTRIYSLSLLLQAHPEREREKERGAGALCFHICAHDVKWICLIEFMTQREPRGWEVESGGGRIKFAPDFYTRTIGGNAKQPLEKGSGLNGAEWEGVRFAWLPALAGSAPPRAQAEVWVPALGSKPRRLLCIDNGGRSQERGEAQNRGHLALGRAGKRQREIIGA